ncbi:MAG: homoserine dehydrogenase [Gammaproteobacteria bacterium]|nr:homoserine dehydrogenase [Gammaproteobacteria bacterium]
MRIGLCGVGNVGSALVELFRENRFEIDRRLVRSISLEQVACRSDSPECDLSGLSVTKDVFAITDNPALDVVVELIGGTDVAKSLVLQAMRNGKHVVTANKALIALHGAEIFSVAREMGVKIFYEASVAGGIPIIKALREGVAGNVINRIAGIVNGTSNYILSEMSGARGDQNFVAVLAEAQKLGYAEADPSFDVDGIDAAHKITILAMLGFGASVNFESVHVEGLSHISLDDLKLVDELGYCLKPLGIATKRCDQLSLRVHPCMVEKNNILSKIGGVTNAVLVDGDPVGEILLVGPGAGGPATASAVMSDLIDLSRGADLPNQGFLELRETSVYSIDELICSVYIRVDVKNQNGVMASVTGILEKNDIGIEAIIQKEVNERVARIAIVTSETKERIINESLSELSSLSAMVVPPQKIRIF